MRRLTRRDFLRIAAASPAVLYASRVLTGCRGDEAPGATQPTAPTTTPTASVAAVRGDDLYAMAQQALDAIGGAQQIVKPGHTVFVKPNLGAIHYIAQDRNPFAEGQCTKTEIVIAVVEECLKAGAREVIVGDGAQQHRYSWEDVVTLDGSTNLAAEAERLTGRYRGKVTLACLNADSPTWVEIPSQTSLEKIAISSLVVRADRVISIPVIKTHTTSHLSLSMKNFIGVTSSTRYGGYERRDLLHTAEGGVDQCSVDIVAALHPSLTIVDGSLCVEGDSPEVNPRGGQGRTVDMRDRLGSWLVLASTDLLAADATVARILGHDLGSMRQLNLAYRQGLGEIREDAIRIIGAELDELRVEWLHAETSGT